MRRLILFLTLAAASLWAQSPSYRIIHSYLRGENGSWDYVVPDPPNHRVFLARQNRLMVVDEDTAHTVARPVAHPDGLSCSAVCSRILHFVSVAHLSLHPELLHESIGQEASDPDILQAKPSGLLEVWLRSKSKDGGVRILRDKVLYAHDNHQGINPMPHAD